MPLVHWGSVGLLIALHISCVPVARLAGLFIYRAACTGDHIVATPLVRQRDRDPVTRYELLWYRYTCVLYAFAALSFIRTVEFPDLLRLRVEMLTENGCDQLALNLVRWCLRCEVFNNDVMLRSYHLLLLHRLGEICEFDSQVSFCPEKLYTAYRFWLVA